MSWIARSISIGGATLLALSALAQGVRVSDSPRGTGNIRIGSDSSRIRDIRVELESDGDFEIRVVGDRTETIRGRYSGPRGERVTLEVRSGFGTSDTTGTGSLILRGDDVLRVDLNGRTRGRVFSVGFVSTERGDTRPDRPGRDPQDFNLSESLRGRGRMSHRGNDDDLNRATVTLERDGDFQITVDGDERQSFGGHWRRNGNTIRLDITRAFGDRDAEGNGTIVLRNRQTDVQRFNLQGEADNRRFTVTFDANRNGNDDDNDNDAISLSQTRSGSGEIDIRNRGRDRERIREARVVLERDGDFEIRLRTGDEMYRFTGRYTRRGNTVTLSLRDSNQGNASGSGRIELDGRDRFTRIDLDGRVDGRRFNADFRAS